ELSSKSSLDSRLTAGGNSPYTTGRGNTVQHPPALRNSFAHPIRIVARAHGRRIVPGTVRRQGAAGDGPLHHPAAAAGGDPPGPPLRRRLPDDLPRPR